MRVDPGLRPDAAHTPRRPARARLRLAERPPPPRPPRRGPHPGTIARPRLVSALLDHSRALAAIVAPAGYGKTTLLAEWSALDPRPFAWVGLTAADDDAGRLAETIAAALSELQPLPAKAVGPRPTADDLNRALLALPPAVLVLDDLHLLRSAATRAVVAGLAAHVPPHTTLAVASRDEPALPLGRLRAQDDVIEVRAGALAMTPGEAEEMLRAGGLPLTAQDTARLLGLTAGWPAALRLAAGALAAQSDGAALQALGDDAIVVDYVRDEILGDLDADDRAFLLRTSVLDALEGPACDAVLDRHDSALRLRALSRANVPLAAVDRTERAFRPHPLLARALRRELLDTDPGLVPQLHRRASRCYERQGDLARAVDHAVDAGDADRVGALLAERAPGLVAAGHAGELDGWLGRLGEAEVAMRPALALAAALARLARGDRDTAERWVALAEEHGTDAGVAVTAGAGVIRAAIARDGVDAMSRDAARAAAAATEHGPWRSFARLLEGSGHSLAGRPDEAAACLDEGARGAGVTAPLVRSLCLAQLAFIALESGDAEDAAALAARGLAAIEGTAADAEPPAALTFAVSGLVLATRGQLDAARRDIEEATNRLELLPDVAPWYGALARVALARAELRLSDAGRARRLLTEASRLVRRTPGATALQAWVDDAWAQADDYAAGPVACPSVLTRAELRVLRLLPSHLSFREIAARLHVSANTIKTQAHAVYRKLDASSRSQAVANARAMGLLDG